MRANCLLMVVALALMPTANETMGATLAVSTTFQVDPAHDGSVNFSTPFNPPLKMRWSLDLAGPVSYPVVVGNLAIVIVGEGGAIGTHLAAINTETGKIVWQKLVSGNAGISYLASDGAEIYLAPRFGPFQAFDGATGEPLWLGQLPANQVNFNFVPVASEGLVFSGGTESGATVFARDETNGVVRWTQNLLGGVPGVTLGDQVVFLPIPGSVSANSVGSGNQIWYSSSSQPIPGLVASYYRHRLYVPDANGGTGIILNAYNGKLIGTLYGSFLAFYGSYLFAISRDSLIASNISTGNRLWSYTANNDNFTNPPIAINGYVYSLSYKGVLYVNAAPSGRLVQTVNIGLGNQPYPPSAPWSGLGIASGVLLVPSGSILAAFGP